MKTKFVTVLGRIIEVPEDAVVENIVEATENGYNVVESISFSVWSKPIHPLSESQYMSIAKQVSAIDNGYDSWAHFENDRGKSAEIVRIVWMGVSDFLAKKCNQLDTIIHNTQNENKKTNA